ncbi:MAG: response regulator [Vicinamibacterales bacterium]
MFRTALTFGGFDVREAADGHTALAEIEQHCPDAIVLDLGLPTLSGHIVLEELAAHAHTRNTPVVVVTGHESPIQTEAMACVLRKPVTPDRLVRQVRRCIVAGSPPVA